MIEFRIVNVDVYQREILCESYELRAFPSNIISGFMSCHQVYLKTTHSIFNYGIMELSQNECLDVGSCFHISK